jgi:hypothetical protein
LKSHIPSSATADVAQLITHTTASTLSFCEVSETANIEQHKMLANPRQLWFYRLAIRPFPGSGFNRSNRTPGISDERLRLRVPRQPRAAIAPSDATKSTTIAISQKVNIPRVNAFKAAVILVKTKARTSKLQKRSACTVCREGVSFPYSVRDVNCGDAQGETQG